MAQMGSQILPARFTTEDGAKELASRPVGTGAYRFVEWVKDERLVMEANRDWWGWEGKAPGVDRVIWKPIPDDFPRIVALDKGEVDIITNVPPDRIKAIEDGRGTRLVTMPVIAVRRLHIELHPAAALRQARAPGAAYALDVNAIVKNLYAGRASRMAAGSPTPTSAITRRSSRIPTTRRRARALLAEAGYANGIDVTLYSGIGTMVNDKHLVEAIADMWARWAIRAKVR